MRADLAQGYLDDRSLSISHIAWLLGFQEPSAFTNDNCVWNRDVRTGELEGLANAE